MTSHDTSAGAARHRAARHGAARQGLDPPAWVRRPAPAGELDVAAGFDAHRPTSLASAVELLGGHARRRAPARVRSVERDEAAGAGFAGLIEGAAATVVRDVFSADDVAAMSGALATARPPGANAGLWALGVPWFAYGADHAEAYAANAARVNRFIARVLPWLHRHVLGWCERVAGEPVALREGWGGPGIVVFPAAVAAGAAGDIHFDWEGIIHEPTGLATETYSVISMVDKPESGGGLRVWGLGCGAGEDGPGDAAGSAAARATGGDEPAVADAAGAVDTVVDYRPGDAVIIDGLDLHQIDAFAGDRDRACLTFHVARLAQGWRVWL